MLRAVLFVAAVLTAFASDCRADTVRRALVIGNDTYLHLPRLERARSDARAVAEALRSLDFEVIEGSDLDRAAFNRKLVEFETALKPGDIAAVFFAGHGVEIDSANYLLPIDMPRYSRGEERLAAKDSFGLHDLLAVLQAKGTQINIVILDACRDNPFSESVERSVGGTRGLARVEAPRGTFVLFSAAARQTALDRLPGKDPNLNSVFTRHLLPQLGVPNLNIVQMAKLVQVAVTEEAARAGKAQEPAYYDNIIGHFFLKQSAGSETQLRADADSKGGPVIEEKQFAHTDSRDSLGRPQLPPDVRGEQKYLDCVRQNDPSCYQAFLAEFPDHGRADQVRKIIAEQVEVPLYQECAGAVERSDVLVRCRQYETRFPRGGFIDDARNRIRSAMAEGQSAEAEENEPPADFVVTAPPPAQDPTMRQFTTYAGFDLPGGDYGSPLQNVSFDTCQSACAQDQACVAFTFDQRNSWCFLKSQITGLDGNQKAISGILASAGTGLAEGQPATERTFQTYDDQDVPGGDYDSPIKNVDYGDCRTSCAGDMNCVAFTFNRRHRWCFLKSQASRLEPNNQATSGVLSSINLTPARADASDVQLYPGMDFAGRDLDARGVRSTSLEQCQSICISNPSCNAFSWVEKSGWCWPKSGMNRPKRRLGVISGRRL